MKTHIQRLEAINKYLPVRDAVKQQLQQRQETQISFAEDTEQLFKPITETTKDIQPVLNQTAKATEKIAKRTKQTKKLLRDLPVEIAAALPPSEEPEQEDIDQEEIPEKERGRVNISDKFIEDVINNIKRIKNVKQLAASAVKGYNNRQRFLKPEYVNDIISRENWYKWIFRIYYDTDQARSSDPNYINYVHEIDNYI